MFPDGGSDSGSAEGDVWGGGFGSHPGLADLWGLPDENVSAGIQIVCNCASSHRRGVKHHIWTFQSIPGQCAPPR